MDPKIRSKLSPTAAQMLQRIDKGEALSDSAVRVLVQLSQPLNAVTEQRLNSAGLSIQTAAGDVLTARIPPRSLESIAAISEVRYVELAQPVFPE